MIREFVSYTRPYDHHIGLKDWSELSHQEQDNLIRSELSSDVDIEELVMSYDWKKSQAQGLRVLNICASLTLERSRIISSHNVWDKNHLNHFLNFYQGTIFAERTKQAFENKPEKSYVQLNGGDFENFSDILGYDNILSLTYEAAKEKMLLGLTKVRPIILDHNHNSLIKNEKLDYIFEKVLLPKGIYPAIKDNKNFPLYDFSDFLEKIKAGKVNLSFGQLNTPALNAISSSSEQIANLLFNTLHMVIAPLILIIGAVISENYWILLTSLFYFPLLVFGTHPTYKKAPFWMALLSLMTLYAIGEENVALVSSAAFMGTVIIGCYISRWHYNRLLLRQAMTNEKELMFLLASGALNLCDFQYKLIWESPLYKR